MPGSILVDTSCLILLSKIGELHLLSQLFGSISVTSEVAREYGHDLPTWATVKTPREDYLRIFETLLDSGEASIIALAYEQPDSLVIIDEIKGRNVARDMGLAFTGTIGLLKLAREKGLVHNMKSVTDSIRKTDFRISEVLLNSLLTKKLHE